MPKQRQTCTRCSQRRQKCDRKSPCTRCVQNNEGHLCTTKWVDGYNPSVHRKYPRKSSPSISWQSTVSSSGSNSTLDASPPGIQPDSQTGHTRQELSLQVRTPDTDQADANDGPVWPTKLPDITIGALLSGKDHQIQQVLYWIGGLYHGPSFRRKLHEAYGSTDILDLQKIDWRWTALLFSILSSGIIGSSEAVSVSWGFSIDDKVRLARLWGAACVSCLNLGNYMSQFHICSVQAIYIMHAYEHLVGSTNQWSALRGVAVAIAKGLGLHKLAPHPDDDRILELDSGQKEAFIEREIGRRTWYNLVIQDWLCSTSQVTYVVAIQKRHFTTTRPRDLDEETMTPIDDTTPTFTLVGSYFFEYAALILDFHNAMSELEGEDEATRYAQLLKFDGELRARCAEKIPKCLSPRQSHDPNWPKWVAWARKMHQASVNHKIIMLHQTFLSKSLRDVRYSYTRWACATAAKNIITLYTNREPEEPQWWVEQAFIVTAGICLVLDLFNRPETDPEAQEYQALIQKAINFLQQFFTSSVAIHGVKLLVSLLQEYAKILEGTRSNATQVVRTAKACPFLPASMTEINLEESSRMNHIHTLPSDPEVPLSQDETAQFNFDIDALGFDDLMDYLPVETALDNTVFHDSICGLTNQNGW